MENSRIRVNEDDLNMNANIGEREREKTHILWNQLKYIKDWEGNARKEG